MKKIAVTALVALLLSGCITNPRGPGLTASLYTWNDRENPVATTITSDRTDVRGLLYGSALFPNLLDLHPDLDTRDAVPYLLEICDQGICHYSVLFPSWFRYTRKGNVAGFATINELTTAFYYAVEDLPQGEVLYSLDQYAVQVMAGEVPHYENGTIAYEDVGVFDYHLNPDQIELLRDPALVTLLGDAINSGEKISISDILNGSSDGDDGGVTPTTLAKTTPENSSLNDSLPSNDPDGLPAAGAFAVGTGPNNGALSLDLNTGAYTYTPMRDFSGSDSFSATVTDVEGYSTTVTVDVTVTPADDGDSGGVTPTTLVQTSPEDTVINGSLPSNDPDGLPASDAFALTRHPAHGEVSLDTNTGSYTYVPDRNFNGADRFTATVTDTGGYATTVAVNVTLTRVNDGGVTPTTLAEVTEEDTTLSATLPSNDPDGLPSSGAFAVGTGPDNGELTLDANTGAYTYTPARDFSGSDSFTATVTDADGYETTVTVNVTVTPADDDAPGGDNGGVTPTTLAQTTAEDTSLNGTLPSNDPDGLPETGAFAMGAAPSNGVLNLNANTGAYTYMPVSDFSGPDSFTATVTDVGGYATTVTVNVTVTPVDDGGVTPTTFDETTEEDAVLNGTLPSNDPDGLPSTGAFAVGASPGNGALSLDTTTGGYTYTPATGFSGPDSFTATVTDLDGHTTTVTVNVTVTPVDDGGVTPTTFDETTEEDTALNGTLPSNDPDGLPSTGAFAVGTSPDNGMLSLDEDLGAFTYTPVTGFNGADSFTVSVTDVGGYASTVTVNVTVTPKDDGGDGGSPGQGPSAHCIPGAYSEGDATSGSGETYAYYCPDGAIYLTSDCADDDTCGGYPIANRACSAGQASEGCTVMSVWSEDIYTCPDALSYQSSECTVTTDGTYSCAVE